MITGSANGEGRQRREHTATYVLGCLHRKLVWTFHTVPRPGEPGNETWPPDAWKNRSGTNAWGFLTVDMKRGIVYVPLGSPTSDFYGADRHGDSLYGNSLVALEAATGKLKWYQQTRPSRSLGFRSGRGADPVRGCAQRPHRSGRCSDHKDGRFVCVRPRDRETALRDGGAPGTPKHGAGRERLQPHSRSR